MVWHSEEMVEVSRRLQEVEDVVEAVAEMDSKSEREGLLELLGSV